MFQNSAFVENNPRKIHTGRGENLPLSRNTRTICLNEAHHSASRFSRFSGFGWEISVGHSVTLSCIQPSSKRERNPRDSTSPSTPNFTLILIKFPSKFAEEEKAFAGEKGKCYRKPKPEQFVLVCFSLRPPHSEATAATTATHSKRFHFSLDSRPSQHVCCLIKRFYYFFSFHCSHYFYNGTWHSFASELFRYEKAPRSTSGLHAHVRFTAARKEGWERRAGHRLSILKQKNINSSINFSFVSLDGARRYTTKANKSFGGRNR